MTRRLTARPPASRHIHIAARRKPPCVAAAVDVAHHDDRPGHDAEVVGVDLELVPDRLDVGEVVGAARRGRCTGPVAAGRARRALDVDLARRVDEVQRALEVAHRERGVDRPHDVDVLRSAPPGCRSTPDAPRRARVTDAAAAASYAAAREPPALGHGARPAVGVAVPARAPGRGAAAGRTGERVGAGVVRGAGAGSAASCPSGHATAGRARVHGPRGQASLRPAWPGCGKLPAPCRARIPSAALIDGRPDAPGRRIARRATLLMVPAIVGANLTGAVVVFALLAWVLPLPDVDDEDTLLLVNLVAAAPT